MTDEQLRQAEEVVAEVGKCSTALLQRKLRIGYGQAAEIVDKLEEMGVIGPALGGNNAREVYIAPKEKYNERKK